MGKGLEFRVLGALEVEVDGSPVSLTSPSQRALVAALLVHANAPVPLDVLVEALWEGSAPARAEDTVRVHVSQLRKVLEPGLADPRQATVLVTVAGGYMLRLDPAHVDSHRFEEHVEAARRALRDGDPSEGRSHVASALRLWRGPPFADVRYRDVAQPEIRRLDELRADAVELRVEAELQLGRHEPLVAELAGLVERYPYRERLWSQLMLALYRVGRQADALQTYRRAQRRLAADLGLEPGPALRRLEQQILLQEPGLELASGIRLPRPVTRFVGREAELAEALERLAEGRLVTFVGAGGIGKTRLAVETARRASERFPRGTWFVDLTVAEPGESLVPHVLAGLDEHRRAAPGSDLDRLVQLLAPEHALLLLDNCEHVADAAAELTAALLTRCPDLQVLATSRERLGVPGERLFHIPTMERSDAVGLLLARAKETLGADALDAEQRAAAAQIARAVDGIPLAIELAAARLRGLSLPDLAARIGDALPILSERSPVTIPRHRTLQATFDWSYRLLAEREQELFRTLWTFRGGWTLAALEAIAGGDVIDPLSRLVDSSMVEVARRGADVRYSLLEPIRQYSRSLVVDAERARALRSGHASFYLQLARSEEQALVEARPAARRLFQVEEANMIEALSWLLEAGAAKETAELANALGKFWGQVGRYDRGRHWLERASAAAPPNDKAALLLTYAWAALGHGEVGLAARLLEEVEPLLQRVGREAERAQFLNQLGNVRAVRGELRAAAAAFEESHRLWSESGDPGRAFSPLVNLAAARGWMGQPRQAEQLAAELQALAEGRHDPFLRAMAQLLRGFAAVVADRPEQADVQLDAAIPALAERGIRWHHSLGLIWRGEAALARGDLPRAVAAAEEARSILPVPWQILLFSLELLAWTALAGEDVRRAAALAEEAARVSLRTDILGGMAQALDLAALVEHRLGAHDRAVILLGAASAAREELGLARTPHQRRAVERTEQTLIADLGPLRYQRYRRRGAALGLRSAVALALQPSQSVPPPAASATT